MNYLNAILSCSLALVLIVGCGGSSSNGSSNDTYGYSYPVETETEKQARLEKETREADEAKAKKLADDLEREKQLLAEKDRREAEERDTQRVETIMNAMRSWDGYFSVERNGSTISFGFRRMKQTYLELLKKNGFLTPDQEKSMVSDNKSYLITLAELAKLLEAYPNHEYVVESAYNPVSYWKLQEIVTERISDIPIAEAAAIQITAKRNQFIEEMIRSQPAILERLSELDKEALDAGLRWNDEKSTFESPNTKEPTAEEVELILTAIKRYEDELPKLAAKYPRLFGSEIKDVFLVFSRLADAKRFKTELITSLVNNSVNNFRGAIEKTLGISLIDPYDSTYGGKFKRGNWEPCSLTGSLSDCFYMFYPKDKFEIALDSDSGKELIEDATEFLDVIAKYGKEYAPAVDPITREENFRVKEQLRLVRRAAAIVKGIDQHDPDEVLGLIAFQIFELSIHELTKKLDIIQNKMEKLGCPFKVEDGVRRVDSKALTELQITWAKTLEPEQLKDRNKDLEELFDRREHMVQFGKRLLEVQDSIQEKVRISVTPQIRNA